MSIQYISQVKEEERMLSKETKTVAKKCSELKIGDIVMTQTVGDSATILEIQVGDFETKITFGSKDCKSSAEFDNQKKLVLIEKTSLN